MRGTIMIFAMLASAVAGADCTICGPSDELVTKWRLANSKRERGEAMKESYKLLESMVPKFEAQGKDPNGQDVAAATRVIGAIYARDYDPRKDVLRLYRKLFANPAFMGAVEDQLHRMPSADADKVREGIRDLPNFD